jgi:hypothetical protein
VDETLEHTFYTHNPATAVEMSGLIAAHGGGAVAVSLLECLQRYAECRDLLRDTDIGLPADPRRLREWSLVMALTGVLNALDRGLLAGTEAVVVHASGSYGRDDYRRVSPQQLHRIEDAAQLLAVVEAADRGVEL